MLPSALPVFSKVKAGRRSSSRAYFKPEVRELVDACFKQKAVAANRWPLRVGTTLIAVPARNEASTIAPTLDALVSGLSRQERSSSTIAILLNACTDDSEEVIEAWAMSRNDVELVTHAEQLNEAKGDDKVRVLVKRTEVPGKLNALASAQEVFDGQKFRNEVVVQVDADTLVTPGTITELKRYMKLNRMGAVGARPFCVNSHGEVPDAQSTLINALAGSKHLQTMSGALIASRSDLFIGVHNAMAEKIPGVLAEDLAYSTLIRAMGFRSGMHPDLIVPSRAAETREQSARQRKRWAQAATQWRQFFGGDALRALSIDVDPAKMAFGFISSVATSDRSTVEKLKTLKSAVAIIPRYAREHVASEIGGGPDIFERADWVSTRAE
jgi:hypothetical protein